MKIKFLVFILSIFITFNHGIASAIELRDPSPLETARLKLPCSSASNWKEINRLVNKQEGMIENIPLNQTPQNWSELICIQYMDISSITTKHSFENILASLRETTLSSYPGNQVTWRIIEKNKDPVIYEWILHKSYKDIPPQHEIVRAFITDKAFHRVGFTRKNEMMNPDEREMWIKLLKENASVVPFQEGTNSDCLSLADKFKDSLTIGDYFHDWEIIGTFIAENGYTRVRRIPPSETGYVTECIEVVTMPNVKALPIDLFFQTEIDLINGRTHMKVKFHVLQKSTSEVIYVYSHPKDHLQLNAVVRTFITDRGYYSISYKRGLAGQMQKEEILKWKEKLQAIQVKDRF